MGYIFRLLIRIAILDIFHNIDNSDRIHYLDTLMSIGILHHSDSFNSVGILEDLDTH